MCKIDMKINLYYANIYKTWTWKEHDKAMVQDHA